MQMTESHRDRPDWSPYALIAALSEGGDKPAVSSVQGRSIETCSRTRLAELIYGSARRLANERVSPGDVVVLHLANSPLWIAAALACNYIGAVVAPVDVLLPIEDLERILEEDRVAVLVSDGASTRDASGIRTLSTDLLVNDTGSELVRPFPMSDSSPMAIFRTSGTTGPPKKFQLTLRNIGSNVRALADSERVRPHDRVLMPLPLHHVYPWVASLTGLSVSASLILPEGLTGPQIADALRAGRPNVVIGVPRLYEALVKGTHQRFRGIARPLGWLVDQSISASVRLRHLAGVNIGRAIFWPLRRLVAPGLRMMVSGGARLSSEVADWIDGFGWDLRSGYGLAETASIFTGNLYSKRLHSEGKPIAGGEIRIDSPDADGVGEILLRGPNIFSGYLNNPVQNAQAFTKDGFFRTGDLGRLDDDGFLYVTGRAKDVIVLAGGENIYPEDVEKKYMESNDIAEIGVFEKSGELHALIVPNMRTIAARGALRPEDAIKTAVASAAKTLPSTQRLSGFALCHESLPQTLLGKIKRFRLPELYAEAKSHREASAVRELTEDEQAWVNQMPKVAVWKLLKTECADRPFDLDSHLQLDLGFDSFSWMTLALDIERSASVRIDPQRISDIGTVRELLVAVDEAADLGAVPKEASHSSRLETDRRRWLSTQSGLERVLGAAVFFTNRALVRLLFRLEVEGVENLPKTGPFLICPNHISDLDPAAIAASLPPHMLARTFWAADFVRVFSSRLTRFLCRILRIFPVDETAPLVAVDLAIDVLRQGGIQVWFPEGWRSADGKLLRFQAGIGMIVQQTMAQVVPAYIEGTLKAWPRERRLPRLGNVKVVFGAPIGPENLATGYKIQTAEPTDIAANLRLAVAELARCNGADILSAWPR